jgi:hypothetical protein
LIPHSTTTIADTSVATANTLSKEATLILLSASQPHLAVYLIRGFCCNRAVTPEATMPAHCGLRGTHLRGQPDDAAIPQKVDRRRPQLQRRKRRLAGLHPCPLPDFAAI